MALTEITYTGTGLATFGPIPFDALDYTTDIKASINGAITTAFTVDPATKIVTFSSAPAIGATVRIYRDTNDENKSATFYSGSAIRASDLNNNFDQTLYLVQEIGNNAVDVDGSNAMAGNLDLNNFKAINSAAPSSGADLANKTYVDDRVSTSAVAGSPYFLQDGTGAVNRSWSSKLKDVVSVKDFGAVGDGVTDDRTAINNAFSAVINAGGGTVYFPRGTYYVSDFIGNVTSTTAEISISVIGEAGTVINCNPAVYANQALFLSFTNARKITVTDLEINCNDKVATGIRVSGTDSVEVASVRNCIVRNCYGIDNAGVTASVQGIAVTSSSLGGVAEVSNCVVENVRRLKQSLACQAIVVTGFVASTITGNYINNVRHDGTNRIDADGIVVFSLNSSGNYTRSTATISGNTILDCEGRFIKLQTEGSALVSGNYMEIKSALDLITNFQAVDSQVGDATIKNNKFYFGSTWTGGASAALVGLQCPTSANLTETNQAFFQRFEGNDAYASKYLPYTILPTSLGSNVASTVYMTITKNRIGSAGDLSNMANTAMFAQSFLYLNSHPSVANTAGKWILTIAGNHVNTYYFLRFPSSGSWPQADYAGKWYWYIYDNVSYGASSGAINLSATDCYTSTMMIKDNNSNISAGYGYLITPFDISKVLDGFDTYVGNQTITNAPPSSTYKRYYKKGGHWGVQSGSSFYLSSNGTTWTQVL